MAITTDPTDSRLGHGVDTEPKEQNEVYLALSKEQLRQGYVRPFRKSYKHDKCGGVTSMPDACAETYAVNPGFYGATYCCECRMHRPVSEFKWLDDGTAVGS
jgi:hypothetical protein